MRKTAPLSVLLPVLLLSACASVQPGAPAEDETPPIAEIDARIAEAVETSANANRAIAEVEVATAAPVRSGPAPLPPPGVVLPPEAVQPVTVDWQGPIETFLQDMANRAGYSFKSSGRRPANPMMITITANDEPLFGVIRRAGIMSHGYADIAFNPSGKVIDIRYGN
ncbi:DotD/TraH family lipoprotein [Cereibacter sphaeroides]|uniref:DotD/TraH family lipoprotein n=1 Tax=Cereibacter sphaeroides TaxID=1063 RepID=UPI001F3E5700|nr:DotD/TraH family lipoprotein [Cereibacter sphaeroides]MCE6959680.1 DotD/TraH family lipoprotein [Cereibacter sphaeroides]MCE6974459.1 DotD/TraH family lipoprotein [Cereibacter sphaeroides]